MCVAQVAYQDGFYWSRDGVRLHYRDYAGPSARPVLLCLPGLTRNGRDFTPLAERLAGQWRVITLSLRGRGESGYAKDPLSYVPLTYVQDIDALLRILGLTHVAMVGTCLGGLLAMMMAPTHGREIMGVVLNDIGPDIAPEGLARVRSHVGRSPGWPSWLHVARDLAVQEGAIYPRYQIDDWLRMAKQICRVSPSGRIIYDYDPRIAEPFRLPQSHNPAMLWAGLAALKDKPLLSVRGALSDILSAHTQDKMQARVPHMECVTIAHVGHSPSLCEPSARAALDRWLGRLSS